MSAGVGSLFHCWVEFVVCSRPCSKGFSPGSPVFLRPQKPTLPNSNSIGNSRATGLSVLPSLNIVGLVWFGLVWFVAFAKMLNRKAKKIDKKNSAENEH